MFEYSVFGVFFVFISIILNAYRILPLYFLVAVAAPLYDVVFLSIGGFRITPYLFLGLLLVISVILSKRKITIDRFDSLVFLFIASCLLSIISISLNSDKIFIASMGESFQDYERSILLHLTKGHFTQLLVLVADILILLSLRLKINTLTKGRNALNGLLFGSLMVLLSGLLLQLMYYNFGFSVLEKFSIFFNADIENALEIKARIDGYNNFLSFPRMYSLAGEPSFTANLFVVIISIYLFSHKNNWKIIILFSVATILTFSTSAYLGLLLIASAKMLLFLYTKSIRKRNIFIYSISSIIILTLILIFNKEVANIITYSILTHYDKIQNLSGSGGIRFEIAVDTFDLFKEAPLLGVGFGGHRTTSLLLSLASNLGIIGLTIFICYNYVLIFNKKSYFNELKFSLFIWLILTLITIPLVGIHFPWYWLLLAILSLKTKNRGVTCPKIY